MRASNNPGSKAGTGKPTFPYPSKCFSVAFTPASTKEGRAACRWRLNLKGQWLRFPQKADVWYVLPFRRAKLLSGLQTISIYSLTFKGEFVSRSFLSLTLQGTPSLPIIRLLGLPGEMWQVEWAKGNQLGMVLCASFTALKRNKQRTILFSKLCGPHFLP